MEKFKLFIKSVVNNGVACTIKRVINMKRQEKFIKHYYNKKTLSKAIKIGEKLVKSTPDNLFYYQQLARAYWKRQEVASATEILKKGIRKKCGLELEEIISEIENSLPDKGELISHKFTFKGGHQNYGLLEHKYDNEVLLTKIVKSNEANGDIFIKSLLDRYKTLKYVTPDIKSILRINDLCFITMEKVDGDVPTQVDAKLLEKIFEINEVITSGIEYEKLLEILEEKVQTPFNESKNKHEVFKALYLIDRKEVLYSFSQYLKKNKFPIEFLRGIHNLNQKIIEGNYYKQIKPEFHFSLQHGDFFRANMLQDYQTGDLKVIDWVGIKVGPRWVDIGIFLAVTNYPFDYILNNFLHHERCSYDFIERLFFVYTLIVAWIVSFGENRNEVGINQLLRPAFEYLNNLTSQN